MVPRRSESSLLGTNSTSDVGNINRLWSVRSQSKGTISTSVFKTVMAAAWATPGAYVFIHRLWRRLGHRIGNHRQLTFDQSNGLLRCTSTMFHRRALYESRSVFTGIGNAQQTIAITLELGSLYEFCKCLVSERF